MQPPQSESPSPDEHSSSDPGLDEQIEQLDERMDRIEQKLDRLTGLLDQAPALAATVGDVADDYARKAAEQGADVDERVNALGPLVLRLTEPEVLETLHGLVERTDRIDQAVEMLDSLEGMAGMVGDMFDTYAMQLEEQGAGVDERVRALGRLLLEATEPQLLETLRRAVDAAGEASREEVDTSGFLGLFRAMRRTNVRRAVNFAVRIGDHFGAVLRREEAPAVRGELPSGAGE